MDHFMNRREYMRVIRTVGKHAAAATGFLALMAGVGGVAVAGFGMPEIDPGSMVNALLVLSGSLLIVNGRRPRK
jgi:hypothetical protein